MVIWLIPSAGCHMMKKAAKMEELNLQAGDRRTDAADLKVPDVDIVEVMAGCFFWLILQYTDFSMILLKRVSLFLVVILFVFPLYSLAQAKDSLLAQLERKWANAKNYTLKIAEMMPEEYYEFRPVPEEMSFREQLLHVAKNMTWLSASYLFSDQKSQTSDTVLKDKASVLKAVNQAYDRVLSAHQRFPAQQLDEMVPFFAGPISRRQVFLLLHDHQTHHLGQLIVYLRLKGIKPPDYVGW
jgi:uncharacterized damage-inducible protein DinB